MRLGVVSGEYPPMKGGVGAYTRILATNLAKLRHEVFVLTGRAAGSGPPEVTVSPIVDRWSIGANKVVRDWVQEHKLDLVNIQYQTAAFGMSPWIHFLPDVLTRIPVVVTFHDLRFPFLFPKAGRLRPWIVRHLAQSSSGCIVTNQEDQGNLARLKNVKLIPIGSNILEDVPHDYVRSEWRERIGVRDGDLLLAYFGLINRTKGLNTLIDCLSHVRGQGIPARLVMIGGESGDSDPTNVEHTVEVRDLIRRMGLDPFVYWTGHISERDVAAYLSASDVVILPFADGVSLRRGTLMAALHYGCAIISTEPQHSISSLRHGENILLVPANDTAALTRAIVAIHTDAQLASQLRTGARELSHSFDWTRIALETSQFFGRIAGRPG